MNGFAKKLLFTNRKYKKYICKIKGTRPILIKLGSKLCLTSKQFTAQTTAKNHSTTCTMRNYETNYENKLALQQLILNLIVSPSYGLEQFYIPAVSKLGAARLCQGLCESMQKLLHLCFSHRNYNVKVVSNNVCLVCTE